MHIKDLVREHDKDRLSKGAIMMWITFAVAIAYWLTGIITQHSMPIPEGLLSFLLALLGYNVARRGTDGASALLAKIKKQSIDAMPK